MVNITSISVIFIYTSIVTGVMYLSKDKDLNIDMFELINFIN